MHQRTCSIVWLPGTDITINAKKILYCFAGFAFCCPYFLCFHGGDMFLGPSVRLVLVNVVYQERCEGIFSNLAQEFGGQRLL